MKNHRWIAKELQIHHAQITNKPRTSAHRHAYIRQCFFQLFSVIRRCYKREKCVICLLIISGKSSMNVIAVNICANNHWYSTHISHNVRVRTTQKLRKTTQYCVNSYPKRSFELLKTWNRVKRRSGEYRRTTTEVPRLKNWWNAQIAGVSRKTRILYVIHAFTRLLGNLTTPLRKVETRMSRHGFHIFKFESLILQKKSFL